MIEHEESFFEQIILSNKTELFIRVKVWPNTGKQKQGACGLLLGQREAPSNTQYQTEIPHSIPSTVELEWNLKLNNIVNKFVTTTNKSTME